RSPGQRNNGRDLPGGAVQKVCENVYTFTHFLNGDVPASRRRSQIRVRVVDGVRVTLFGEKTLPMCGVIGVDGVAGNDRIEMRLVPVGLRAQQPAEPLRLLLS